MAKHIDKRKTLYSFPGYRYGKDGSALCNHTQNAVRGIFLEYLHKDYSPREIARIMIDAVTDIELETIFKMGPKDDKDLNEE